MSRPPVGDSEGPATVMRSMCVLSTFQNHCDSSEMCASVVCALCLEGMNHNCWPEKLLTVYAQGLRESQRNFYRPLISWDLFIFKKIVFLALCSRANTFPPEHGGFTGIYPGQVQRMSCPFAPHSHLSELSCYYFCKMAASAGEAQML